MQKRAADRRIRELVAFAKEEGAFRAGFFAASKIALDERVRLKCQIPLCPHFGRSLVCPPHVPSMEEFRPALARYGAAVLLQTRAPLGPSSGARRGRSTRAMEDAALALHALVAAVEGRAMALGFPFALGLIGGHCRLCGTCVGPGSGAACRHPLQARPSLEAMGIDVLTTSARAGLPIEIPPTAEVLWTGLVLVD